MKTARTFAPTWRRGRGLAAGWALLAIGGIPGAALSEAAQTPTNLVVASDDNYPPYIFRNQRGQLQGIVPDQWTLWQQKTGVRVELRAMDWSEAQRVMAAGEADVIDTIFRTPEREQRYQFTAPYARIEVPIFSHKTLGGITDTDSLKGFTVGVKAGDAAIEMLQAGGIDSLKLFPSYEAIILAAKNDELKVFTVDEPAAVYYLYKYDIAAQFRQSFVLYTGEFHRATTKTNPEIFALVQEGFNRITPREYRTIDHRWMGTPFPLKETLRAWLPALFLIAGVVSFLLATNFVLRQRVRARTAELHATLENLRQSLDKRKKSEEELRASKEYFASVFDAMNDALLIVDPDTGAIEDANRRTEEMYGYPRDELLASDWKPLCADMPSRTEAEGIARIHRARTEGPQTFEWLGKRRDGHVFWVDVSLRRVQLGAGDRIVVTVRDITDRKANEEERRNYERRLQEANKLESLGMLAGGIAHDFNNLLAAILGNIELALMAIPEKSPAHEDIQAAITATKRAGDLVQQMLAYSGKGRFLIEPVDISAIARETVHILHTSIPREAKVNLRLADALPLIEADVTQLRQVAMNLVLNAAEALRDGAGTIDIATGVMESLGGDLSHVFPPEPLPPGPYAYLEVADSGSGIKTETLNKIFDPFYSTKFIGRGLGLSVVYGIVRGHKGAIQVNSVPGQGTAFRVLFPVHPPPTTVLAPPAEAPAEWSGAGRLVLLVDDDPGVVDTAVKLLQRLGLQVLCAMDGDHAIHLFRAQAQNLAGIILDLTMPHLDGAQTLAELRRIRPDIPVIVSSGHGKQEVLQRFVGLNPEGFLHKPYTLEGLRNALGNLLPPTPS